MGYYALQVDGERVLCEMNGADVKYSLSIATQYRNSNINIDLNDVYLVYYIP